jgi:hypothetical protein
MDDLPAILYREWERVSTTPQRGSAAVDDLHTILYREWERGVHRTDNKNGTDSDDSLEAFEEHINNMTNADLLREISGALDQQEQERAK